MSRWYELNDDGTTTQLPEGQYPTSFDMEHKRVAETVMAKFWVSTVFLGLDHSYLGGPPLLFETMVFPSKDNFNDMLFSDMLCWRYPTKAAAAAGHAFLVAALEAGTPLDEIEQPDGAS